MLTEEAVGVGAVLWAYTALANSEAIKNDAERQLLMIMVVFATIESRLHCLYARSSLM